MKKKLLLPLITVLLSVTGVFADWKYATARPDDQTVEIYPFLYDFFTLDQEENEVINKMLDEINNTESNINGYIKAREDGLLGWYLLTYSYLGSMDPYYGEDMAKLFGSDYDFVVSYETDNEDRIVAYSMYITYIDVESNFSNGKYCDPVNKVDFIYDEEAGRYIRTDVTPGKAKYAYYDYELSWIRRVKAIDYTSWVSTE